jgi:hypothetical protein
VSFQPVCVDMQSKPELHSIKDNSCDFLPFIECELFLKRPSFGE